MIESAHLLDRWLPPEGAGRPIGCITTAFVFEPDFFEGECLSRFLGFDGVRGETSELAYVIEEEERLAETSVSAIVDRSQAPGNRNLRWDLLSVSPPRGLLHAKVTLLTWERFVRVIVSSANLTRAAYRSNVEVAVSLEAHGGSELPAPLFRAVLDALREIVALAPPQPAGPGPSQRALETIDRTAAILDGFALRPAPARGAPKITLAVSGPGRAVLSALPDVWSGSVPRSATVLSPYFDTDRQTNPAAAALTRVLARTGERRVTFVLPTDQLSERTIVRAPASLTTAIESGVTVDFEAFPPDPSGEPRRLHAKSLLLEGADWVAAFVGSSNFTAAGFGLSPASHVEVNVALGAQASSEAGKALAAIIPGGDELEIGDVEWEAQEDEDEDPTRPVPRGFLWCLAQPGPEPTLLLELDEATAPTEWSISTPADVPLTDRARWREAGNPRQLRLSLPDDSIPFWVKVRWREGNEWFEAGMPVNVTDPGKLPPPLELRSLPVELLLRVLASTRPIYESIAHEVERREQEQAGTLPPELDPLKRYSSVGQLLGRARRVSAALEGLRRRLEQPVGSLDTLRWRLFGPIGPKAIAEGLLREAEDPSAGFVAGEASFILAELALTLKRVEWASTFRLIETRPARREVRKLLDELAELRDRFPVAAPLESYLDEAFAEAAR
jgi:phosphatidylserine/phosphatidylglycerophosphate/cardiolipin synthase-like enzyme